MLRLHKFYLFSESIRMKISIVTHLVHTTVNHAARSKDIIHSNVAIASISDNVTSTRSVLLWMRLFTTTRPLWHWSVAVGELWLVRSHSHWSVAVGGLWLVRFRSSCLFHTGQSLLVDFGLCVSTRLVFFTLVSRYWWTLTCTLPLVLSFWRRNEHWPSYVYVSKGR